MLSMFREQLTPDRLKSIRCPKCEAEMELITLKRMKVRKCPINCGIWLDQAQLDVLRDLNSLGDSSTRFGELTGYNSVRRR
jgi:Zn-finger nucleic acid-binding protein